MTNTWRGNSSRWNDLRKLDSRILTLIKSKSAGNRLNSEAVSTPASLQHGISANSHMSP